MKLYDISRELFSAPVYPGDPAPYIQWICRMDEGGSYNVSAFFSCAHNGTHIDAPLHYLEHGAPVDQMDLGRFLGPCKVVSVSGALTAQEIAALSPNSKEMLLLKGAGQAHLDQSAAQALVDAQVSLVGTDALSIGIPEQEAQAHVCLLQAGIPILEGLALSDVPDGDYILLALPLKLKDMEASPVRAVLLDFQEEEAALE